jgi:hypothetical protein
MGHRIEPGTTTPPPSRHTHQLIQAGGLLLIFGAITNLFLGVLWMYTVSPHDNPDRVIEMTLALGDILCTLALILVTCSWRENNDLVYRYRTRQPQPTPDVEDTRPKPYRGHPQDWP